MNHALVHAQIRAHLVRAHPAALDASMLGLEHFGLKDSLWPRNSRARLDRVSAELGSLVEDLEEAAKVVKKPKGAQTA